MPRDMARNAADDARTVDTLASHFTLSRLEGLLEPLDVPGAEGWQASDPHPALNLARWTTDEPDRAAAALDGVLARFRARGGGFDWMTGPRCARAGLTALLPRQGFGDPAPVAAMSRPLTALPDPDSGQQVRVWMVTDPGDDRVWQVMAGAFAIPDVVASVYHRAYTAATPRQRSQIFAASLPEGGDAPVGVGYLSYIGGTADALLRVSCTLAEYRGRGVYRALVLRRLHHAAGAGCRQMHVHAYSEASEACLAALGFERTGTLYLHRWQA